VNQFVRITVIILLGICLLALFPGGCSSDGKDAKKEYGAKNIIFMVPDGMGLSNVTATRTYLNGVGGEGLSFESLPHIGYQRTSSRNSFITDSAAGASAWASGEKFDNGEISCRDNDGDGVCDGTRIHAETILEMAEALGMATGLVVTSNITHATPAAFGAHVHDRNCESEIFRQLIENDIDVLLGGGIGTNRSSCLLDPTNRDHNKHQNKHQNKQLIARARDKGYAYVTDKMEMGRISDASKLLGLFKDGGLTPISQRTDNCLEPTLTEMTRKALDILEDDTDGFFLMVESSQIDWANHARDAQYMIHEVIEFDNAVRVVTDWLAADARRSENTFLVIVADHETGGVIIEGPYGSLPTRGDANSMEITFGSNRKHPERQAGHTAADTLIWSNRPECARAMDNTKFFTLMSDFLNIQ